ncbi:MAG: hypothetical protein V4611_02910 [Patescibacteria group bacterium]
MPIETEHIDVSNPIKFAKELHGTIEDVDLAHSIALAQASAREELAVAGRAEQLFDSILEDPATRTPFPDVKAAELKAAIESGQETLPVQTPVAIELAELHKDTRNPWTRELASRALTLASNHGITQDTLSNLTYLNAESATSKGREAAYKWAKQEKDRQEQAS